MLYKASAKFLKDIDNITDKQVLKKFKALLEAIEKASSLKEIPNLKKMRGFEFYYRIKISDYRIGIDFSDSNTLIFCRILHRKAIYRKFP